MTNEMLLLDLGGSEKKEGEKNPSEFTREACRASFVPCLFSCVQTFICSPPCSRKHLKGSSKHRITSRLICSPMLLRLSLHSVW